MTKRPLSKSDLKMRRIKAKQEWFIMFERNVISLDETYSGLINWVEANNYYTLGRSAEDAAIRYVSNLKESKSCK